MGFGRTTKSTLALFARAGFSGSSRNSWYRSHFVVQYRSKVEQEEPEERSLVKNKRMNQNCGQKMVFGGPKEIEVRKALRRAMKVFQMVDLAVAHMKRQGHGSKTQGRCLSTDRIVSLLLICVSIPSLHIEKKVVCLAWLRSTTRCLVGLIFEKTVSKEKFAKFMQHIENKFVGMERVASIKQWRQVVDQTTAKFTQLELQARASTNLRNKLLPLRSQSLGM